MADRPRCVTSVNGVTVTGEIVALATNDITVRLVGPLGCRGIGKSRGLHVPHFAMAYRPNWLADDSGDLTERGLLKAQELLAELYTENQSRNKGS